LLCLGVEKSYVDKVVITGFSEVFVATEHDDETQGPEGGHVLGLGADDGVVGAESKGGDVMPGLALVKLHHAGDSLPSCNVRLGQIIGNAAHMEAQGILDGDDHTLISGV